MVAVRIPSKDTDTVWDEVAPILDNPKVLNEWATISSVYSKLINAQADLWVYSKPITAALVACIKTKLDGSRVYKVELMASPDGADMAWNDMIKEIEKHAKAIGCTSMRVQGRKGWQRALPEYRTEQVVLEKEL